MELNWRNIKDEQPENNTDCLCKVEELDKKYEKWSIRILRFKDNVFIDRSLFEGNEDAEKKYPGINDYITDGHYPTVSKFVPIKELM